MSHPKNWSDSSKGDFSSTNSMTGSERGLASMNWRTIAVMRRRTGAETMAVWTPISSTMQAWDPLLTRARTGAFASSTIYDIQQRDKRIRHRRERPTLSECNLLLTDPGIRHGHRPAGASEATHVRLTASDTVRSRRETPNAITRETHRMDDKAKQGFDNWARWQRRYSA